MYATTEFYPIVSYECQELHELMHQNGTKCSYPDKTIIVNSEDLVDDFFFIDEGKVRYLLSGIEGDEKVLLILDKGSFFGAVPILQKLPNAGLFVITEMPTVIYKINIDSFYRLLNTSAIFRNSLIKGLSKGFHRLMLHIESLSFNSCKERLYQLLCASTDKEVVVDECWYILKHQYPQNDIAKIIGANRVTVTKLIHELCQVGLIRIVNRNIQVKL